MHRDGWRVWLTLTGVRQCAGMSLEEDDARQVCSREFVGRRETRDETARSKEADVRKLIVQEWMTLDGVIQAPGMKDEDRSGGFEHGGWSTPYFEDTSMKWLVDNLNEAGGFVLGRRTYDIFAEHWPEAPEAEQPMAKPLTASPSSLRPRRSPNHSSGRTQPCSRAT